MQQRILALCGLFAAVTVMMVGAGQRVAGQAVEHQLYVSILDRSGAPVSGLGPRDFVVREDGMQREVLRVESATAPLQLALLVDDSQQAESHVSDMRKALPPFIDRMAARAEMAFVTFGERPQIRVDYTKDPGALRGAVQRLFAIPSSGAYLLDAVADLCRGFTKRDAARPVVLVIMTEGPEFSTRHYQSVVEQLRESGAALHVLSIGRGGGDAWSDEIRNRNALVDEGTRLTGGRRDNLLTSMALSVKLDEVATELLSQYLVIFARPQSLIPPTRTEVSAANLDWTARGTLVKTGAENR